MNSSGYDRLFHQYKDIVGAIHLIEIYRDGYTSSYEIKYSKETPVLLQHNGSDKGDWDFTFIQGQELVFNYVMPREDVYIIDELLDSEYKDWHVDYTINSQLIFTGYLKPENINKVFEINPPNIEIQFSATDGLAELKEVKFYDVNKDIIVGKHTLLEILKYALTPVEIPINFMIQVNTYETTFMSSTDCPILKILVNSDCFYSNLDKGKNEIEAMNCWDVIETILKIFNCKLKQYNGYYYITNYYELDSYVFLFDYNSLEQISRTSTNNIIDISDFLFSPSIDQQRVHPLKSILTEVISKDVGGDTTGMNLSDWENSWDLSSWDDWVNLTDGSVYLEDGPYDENNIPYLELKSDFAVSKTSDNDYFKISFDYRIESVTPDTTVGIAEGLPALNIVVKIRRPDGSWTYPVAAPIYGSEYITYDSYSGSNFKIGYSGNYNIRIYVLANYSYGWVWTHLVLQVKNISIKKLVNGTLDDFNPVVTTENTSYFRQINIKGFEDLNFDTKLFDGESTTATGSLLGSGGSIVTKAWNTYGGSEAIQIVDLCSRRILMNRSKYKNFLRCTIIDRNRIIGFQNIVIINGLYYTFNSYNRDYRLGQIDVELIELIIKSINSYPVHLPETALKSAIIYKGTEEPPDAEYQKDHGFIVGDVIRLFTNIDGSYTFYKALADNLVDATAVGVVYDVISVDTFRYKSDGYIPESEDFTFVIGLYYYLSPTDPGKMVSTPTYEEYEIEQAIGFGTDKGFKVEIDARNLNFKQIVEKSQIPGGVPIYMHWQNSDIQTYDSYTESDVESSDSSGYVFYPSDYDRALLQIPTDVRCEYGTKISINYGEIVIKKFVTDLGVPNTTVIPAGGWFFETYLEPSIQNVLFYTVHVYKRDLAGNETELFTFEQRLRDPNYLQRYDYTYASDTEIKLEATDRLVFEYCAKSRIGPIETIKLYVEGETRTNVKVPIFAGVFNLMLDVKTEMSVEGNGTEIDKISLVNDSETPGNSKYYGTDADGEKGYHDLPNNQVQSDWNQSDTGASDYIKNKPTIPEEGEDNYVDGATFSEDTRDLTLTRTGDLEDITVNIPCCNPVDVIGGTTYPDIKYGALYNWWAATDVRNIAPAGWRVANDDDYKTLADYVGANGDYTDSNTIAPDLKDTAYWDSGLEGNNQYGFNLRAGGFRVPPGDFINMGTMARLITSDTDTFIHCWVSYGMKPYAFFKGGDSANNYGNLGYSIRLIKTDSTDTGTMTGNDGKVYPTVKIGNQVWMACNLAETEYRNGDPISFHGETYADKYTNAEWAALTTEAMCWYDDNPDNGYTDVAVIQHNALGGLQGGSTLERYHHTKAEADTHVFEAPVDNSIYARVNNEWIKIGVLTDSSSGVDAIIEKISFEYKDIETGVSQTYWLDDIAKYGYTILGAILCSDTTMDAVEIQINGTPVIFGSNSYIDVTTSSADTEATDDNVVVEDDVVTLVTSGTDGGAEYLRGSIYYQRT